MRDHSAAQAAEQRAQREAKRAQRLRRAKLKLAQGQGPFNAGAAGAKTGAARLPASGARPPGSGKSAGSAEAGVVEAAAAPGEEQFLLEAWDSEGEDAPGAKRKPEG
jgi:hypothetical protein